MERSSMKSFLIRKFLDKDFNFFFGFFLGTILLSAIAMAAFSLIDAFLGDVDHFRTEFTHGYTIGVNSPEYLPTLKEQGALVYMDGRSGEVYNVSISYGEESWSVDYFDRGLLVLNAPNSISIREGEVLLNSLIANSFECKVGDTILIAGQSYRYAGTMDRIGYYLSTGVPSFALTASTVTPSYYSAVFFDMDDALDFSKKINDPSDITDNGGVLEYYKGMKFLRNVFIAFGCFMALICVLYYAVVLSIYLMRKSRFGEITRAFGGSKVDYTFSVASAFSIVSLFGTGFGLLLTAGIRRIINYWAGEIIGMELNPVSFFLLFIVYTFASLLTIGALSFMISWRVDRDGIVFC